MGDYWGRGRPCSSGHAGARIKPRRAGAQRASGLAQRPAEQVSGMAGGGHWADRGCALGRRAGPKGCGRSGRDVRGCLVSGRGAHGRRGASRCRGLSGRDALVGRAGQGRRWLPCRVFRFFRGAGAVRTCCLRWPGRGTLCRLQPGFQPVSVEQVVHRGRIGKNWRQTGRIIGITLDIALKLLQCSPALDLYRISEQNLLAILRDIPRSAM